MRILIGLILCFAYVNCKLFPECKGKPNRTYVASYRKNGCRSFIYCNEDNSFEEMCPLGLAFNPVELTCEPKEIVYCVDDIEMNNNVSPRKSPRISSEIVKAMTKQHPTPPGKPLKITPTNPPKRLTPKANSNQPITTRKPLESSTLRPKPTSNQPIRTKSPTNKLTSLILSTTRKNTPITAVSPNRPSQVTTNRPPSKSKSSSSTKSPKETMRTESPIHIPTPPGSQNVPYQSKGPTSTTLPKETVQELTTTKSHPKTKAPSSPTTKIYQTELFKSSTITNDITTKSSIQEECSKKTVGSFADPDDCHFYYRCMKGTLRKEECPKGFGWDVNSKMCSSKGCSK